MKEKPLAWNKINEVVASLLNFAGNQRYELTAWHDQLFPHYAAAGNDDDIVPNDSVLDISFSHLTCSSTCVNELAAQRECRCYNSKWA